MLRAQLVAVHPDGRETVINDTPDIRYLEEIADKRGGLIWLGSDICDLKVQVTR